MNDFQLHASHNGLGLPICFTHDLAVHFHSHPIEWQIQVRE